MKVCIAGDRECTDVKFLEEAIVASGFKITEVVHGDARGSDHLGRDWGKRQGLLVKSFKADWDNIDAPGAVVKENKFGKYNAKAGNDRNALMAEYAEAFIILQPNGVTSGSDDMRKQAEKLGKPVYVHFKKIEDYEYHF